MEASQTMTRTFESPTANKGRAAVGVLASVPWCCIAPGLLGLVGASGTGLALSVQALTFPLLAVTVAALGCAWYRQLRHGGGGRWKTRSRIILLGSTIFAVAMWSYRLYPML